MDVQEEDSYPLHTCVFDNNVRHLAALLRVIDVGSVDKHGNTALHLAVMLGRKECVQILLAHGAPAKVKNVLGWSPLAEAVSYGDRQTIASVLRKLKQQIRESMEQRRPNLIQALAKVPDFVMELKWDFQSWLPLVSKLLPSDICRIQKRGTAIRFDSTLVEFSELKWEYGDITVLFNGSQCIDKSLILMDNSNKVYQRIQLQEHENEIEDEVDALMSNDLVYAQLSTKSVVFTKTQSGWLFKEDKKEKVGQFACDYYTITGMTLDSHKRREHLSEQDLQKNKLMLETLTKGKDLESEIDFEPPPRRQSLPDPVKRNVTWHEYINSEPGKHPVLGREMVFKKSRRVYKASAAMCLDFPLSVDMLLSVLEAVAPFKHFAKFRNFIQLRLPPGFPVKIDIPILPTISAKVTFKEFRQVCNLPEYLFEVPTDYTEDPNRFPDI